MEPVWRTLSTQTCRPVRRRRQEVNRNCLQKTEEVEEDAVTLPETPEKEVEADAGDVKEAVPALVLNDKSAMPMQAFEVAKEEAAGMEVQTMLDMEKITLTSIMPTKTPPMTMEASAEEAVEDTDIAREVYAEEVKKEAVPPLSTVIWRRPRKMLLILPETQRQRRRRT